MDLFGSTRSRVARDHALICPDSFVPSALPGWERTRGVVLVAPRLGARFTQYLALMEPDAVAAQAAPGVQRVVYVLEGSVAARPLQGARRDLTAGGYAFVPADTVLPLRAEIASRVMVFEKRYAARTGVAPPRLV